MIFVAKPLKQKALIDAMPLVLLQISSLVMLYVILHGLVDTSITSTLLSTSMGGHNQYLLLELTYLNSILCSLEKAKMTYPHTYFL